MDQKWYYEDHGRAKGPISTRDLVNKIQKGDMTLMDLVFKEGSPSWLPAESFSEITELIGNISLQESADWIVLKTVNVDGKNINEQIGPFNAQQILDLIDRGKIRFSDYVWRTGYEKWVPLGRVDEFEKPLKSSVDVDKSLYTKPRHFDLLQPEKKEAPLKKVTPVIVSSTAVSDEPPPIEAKGEDLVSAKVKPQAKVVHRSEIITEKAQVKKSPEPAAAAPVPEKKKPARREPELPPLPEAQPQQKLPEQKFPIFDEPSLVSAPAKPQHAEPPVARHNTLRVETVTVEAPKLQATPAKAQEKPKIKELPPLPNTNPVSAKNVEKISSADALVDKAEKQSQKIEKDKSPEAPANQEQLEKMNGRWMQVGLAASFVVIVFSVGLFFVLNKKKSRSAGDGNFSIKIDPPPAPVINTPAPVPKSPPVVVQQEAPKPKPVVPAEKPTPQKPQVKNSDSKDYDVTPTVGGSAKNKSYYHHKERIYLFYTSNEGEQLAGELQKASSKHQKNAKQWKNFYGGWKNKAKTYVTKVSKEARKARLHRSLFKQLMTSASDLEDIGRDINTQMSDGRSPSKVASAKNLESQFKNIGSNARNLDR